MAESTQRGSDSGTGQPWYAGGLRFRCLRCGACCSGPPGYVWLQEGEAERIAEFLGLSARLFRRRYCRNIWFRVSLQELPNGDCAFLGPEGCRIYPVRPVQCRTFPFWRDALESRARWHELAERCPGIGRGRLYSRRQVERIAAGERST